MCWNSNCFSANFIWFGIGISVYSSRWFERDVTKKTYEISWWDSFIQRRERLICALSIVKVFCVNMYFWDLFLSKLTFTSKNFACCQQNKIEETMSNLYNNDPIDHYFNSRHERSIIRMCALLWVLKVHEDNVNRRLDSQNVYNSGSNSSTGNCKSNKVRFVEKNNFTVKIKIYLEIFNFWKSCTFLSNCREKEREGKNNLLLLLVIWGLMQANIRW